MNQTADQTSSSEAIAGGFGSVDDKGRVTLIKSVREALDLVPGSQVAQVVVGGAVLLVPQDEHLAALERAAQRVLAVNGLTVQDFLDELPAARQATFIETYGDELLREIEALVAEGPGAAPKQ